MLEKDCFHNTLFRAIFQAKLYEPILGAKRHLQRAPHRPHVHGTELYAFSLPFYWCSTFILFIHLFIFDNLIPQTTL